MCIRDSPYGDKYWSDQGITDPKRDDYIFHIEYNHFHDYGLGILTDYGAVYIGSPINCIYATEEEVRQKCYSYIHVYNNLIHDAKDYLNGGAYLYSDTGKLLKWLNSILLEVL